MKGLDREEGDRQRRQSAVLRFLSLMHEFASERDLVQALVQAAAVWFDLDVRAYHRELSGRFVLGLRLPGAPADGSPEEIDAAGFLKGSSAIRLSSMADLEQLGWHNVQHEVLVLPLARGREVDWLLLAVDPVGSEAESTLSVACGIAGGVLERLQQSSERKTEARVARRLADGHGSVPALAQNALEELVAGVGASRARLVLKPEAASQPVTLALVGPSLDSLEATDLVPGARRVSPECLVLARRVTGGGVAVVSLGAAAGARFGPADLRLAEAGAGVLAAWLGGVTAATEARAEAIASPGDARAVQEPPSAAAPAVPTPTAPAALDAEMERIRRLSLKGGVLVASFGSGEPPVESAVSSVIDAMRQELRSSDMLAQLAGGDIAALLVRSSPEGVAAAAWRVRKRLERVARERRMPPVVLGHTLYPAEGAQSLNALVARARQQEPADPTEGWRFVM